MIINRSKTNENPNYIGWDEDNDGNWNEWFMCPACEENNYIIIENDECSLCRESIEWVD